MNVLVTGGAGYIGSVIVEELLKEGNEVVVFDNLSKGHRESVSLGSDFVFGSIKDREKLIEAMSKHQIEAVIHMAASSLVGESYKNPHHYYLENVSGTLTLIDAMLTVGVKRMVFSSTAAVYGVPEIMPITEEAPTKPVNPYGDTKLAIERALHWYEQAHKFHYVSLRYFNAAGASEKNGEDHTPETHLIPNVLKVAAGVLPHVNILGEDYNTPDGTCIRDYIHVRDLAMAHILSLTATEKRSHVFNLGYGSGYSVAEVVEMARQVTGKNIPTESAPRREGDPPVLIAAPDMAMRDLGWAPKYSELDTIIESAWKWYLDHPNGYK